ncbi:MAG: GNAT family protein [Bacteroidota bacterium]
MALSFSSDIVLENERIRLRPLRPDDAHALLPIATDPEIWTYTTQMVTGPEDLNKYIQRALGERMLKSRYPLAIEDLLTNTVCGSTSFLNYSPANFRIEIGHTWLGKAYQGKGINHSAKFLLFQYAFEELGIVRLELKTDVLNQQSRRAMQKVGAVEEGILRSHTVMHDGRRRDTIYYSILVDEWEGIKRRVFQEMAYK